MSVIELHDVSRWYGSVLGVSRVSLQFEPGVTALLGPNGAGKSTLLKLVTGLLHPSSGTVRVFDMPPFANPAVYRRLGLVPEEEEFRVRVNGLDWLAFLLQLNGLDEETALDRARKTLENVGLTDAGGRRVSGYSRGMKQRLRIAQAIAHDPEVLILDEPLTGLDPVGRREVMDWIRGWGEAGKTVVVSSHILHEVEMMTREVTLMSAGRIMAHGNFHDIRRLLDAHPHRIRVSTPEPKVLAARFLSLDGILSISFSEEEQAVQLETREPDRFYSDLADLVVDEGVVVNELTSPDDNLESVFHYLVDA